MRCALGLIMHKLGINFYESEEISEALVYLQKSFELMDSIRSVGVLSYLLVRPIGDDFENFEIASRIIDNDQKSFTVGASWRRLVEGGFVTTTVSQSRSHFSFEDPGDDGIPVLANDSEELDTRLTVQGDFESRSGLTMAVGLDASRSSAPAPVPLNKSPKTSTVSFCSSAFSISPKVFERNLARCA